MFLIRIQYVSSVILKTLQTPIIFFVTKFGIYHIRVSYGGEERGRGGGWDWDFLKDLRGGNCFTKKLIQ